MMNSQLKDEFRSLQGGWTISKSDIKDNPICYQPTIGGRLQERIAVLESQLEVLRHAEKTLSAAGALELPIGTFQSIVY